MQRSAVGESETSGVPQLRHSVWHCGHAVLWGSFSSLSYTDKKNVEWVDVCFLLHLCPASCLTHPLHLMWALALISRVYCAWPAHRDNNYPSVCALFTWISKGLSSCNSLRREKTWVYHHLWKSSHYGWTKGSKGLYGYVWGLVGKHCFHSRSTAVRNCHWQEDVK